MRPMAPPLPAAPAYTPSARVRAAPSLNVSAIKERAVGATIAPPAPCTTREAINHVEVVARPPASEPVANNSTPTMNILRLPNRSPARPPSSSRPPNASEYALTTHSRSVVLNRSARWIDGRATLTMVPSRTTISCANAITINAMRRLRGASADWLAIETDDIRVSSVSLVRARRRTCLMWMAATSRQAPGEGAGTP